MPLPDDPKTKWPPEEWLPAYREFAEHAAWYSGDPQELLKHYTGTLLAPSTSVKRRAWMFWARRANDTPAQERQLQLHVPLAGDIASTSSDLLFGEPPKLLIPEAHEEKAESDAKKTQDRLDELVHEGGIHNTLIEAADIAAGLGGVYIYPAWDKDAISMPLMLVGHPDSAVPEFRKGILTAVTFWKRLGEKDSNVYRHLERHEVDQGEYVILHGLYAGTEDELGDLVPLTEHEKTRELAKDVQDGNRIPTGLKFLAVRYIPNMRPNRRDRASQLGQSDYAGQEGLMDALDETYSSWMRDIRLAKARIFVDEMYLERKGKGQGSSFDVDQELFAKMSIDPSSDKDPIKDIQFAIRAGEHEQTGLSLIERIVSGAGYSPQSFGLHIEGRAESGTALNVRKEKSFTTRGKKERYFTPNVEAVAEAMLQLDASIFESGITPFRPRLECADVAAPDPKTTAESIELLGRAKAISTLTRVKMANPDLTKDEAEEEANRILQEDGLQLPDPMQEGEIP